MLISLGCDGSADKVEASDGGTSVTDGAAADGVAADGAAGDGVAALDAKEIASLAEVCIIGSCEESDGNESLH
jgi:hypothetical protein